MRGGRTLLLFLALFFLFFAGAVYVNSHRTTSESVSISDLASMVKQGQVTSIVNKSNELEVHTKDGKVVKSTIEPNANLSDYGITPDKVNISAETQRENVWMTIFLTANNLFSLALDRTNFKIKSAAWRSCIG